MKTRALALLVSGLLGCSFARSLPAATTVNVSTASQLIIEINNCNAQIAPYVGANTIVLADGNYDLAAVHNFWYGGNGLPAIRSDITLRNNGNGATIRRTGGPAFRIFYVSGGNISVGPAGAGTLTLINLTLSGGQAVGGAGGELSGGSGLAPTNVSGDTAVNGGSPTSTTT